MARHTARGTDSQGPPALHACQFSLPPKYLLNARDLAIQHSLRQACLIWAEKPTGFFEPDVIVDFGEPAWSSSK
jgi:hypothetical protein